MVEKAHAVDRTWIGGTGNWNTPANWSGSAVPSGTADRGIFTGVGASGISFSANANVGRLQFNGGAYIFAVAAPRAFTLNGSGVDAGIRNDSVSTQTFNVTGTLTFSNGSSASVVTGTGPGTTINNTSGTVNFNNASKAGNSTITNSNILVFRNTSTAEVSTITNNNTMSFLNTATGGNANITNTVGAAITFNTGTASPSARVINSGTVTISATTTLGSISGPGNIALTATADLTTGVLGNTESITGNITGGVNNTFTKTGGGTLTLGGAGNTYGGGTVVNGGVIQGTLPTNTALTVTSPGVYNVDTARTIGSLAGNGSVTLNTSVLTVGGNNTTTTYSGVMSSTGPGNGLRKSGTGNFTLSGTNTYTGMTTVNNGALTLTGLGSLAGPVTVDALKTFNVNGTVPLKALNVITNNGNMNFNTNASAGNSTITNTGTGTIMFNNSATAGNSIITNTGLVDFDDTTTANNATIINNLGGTVNIDGRTAPGMAIGSLSGAGNVVLGARTLTTGGLNQPDTISGVISGTTGGVTKVGTNNLTLTNTNTYKGATTVNGGALTLTGTLAGPVIVNAATNFNVNGPSTLFLANNTVTNNGTTNFNATGSAALADFTNNAGGIVDISGTTLGTTIGSLTGAGNVNLGSKALTLGGRNIANTISGVISGVGGSLIKTGTQTLTLSAANTYTGMTTVNNGTLTLTGLGSLDGPVTVDALKTFNVNGTVPLKALNVITNNGNMNINNNASTGNSNITNSGTIMFNNSATAGNSIIINTGLVDFDDTTTANNATIINNLGGIVDIAGRNAPGMAIGSLSGAGNVLLGANTLTTGGLNTSDTISGVISGINGDITKVGTGTLTLEAANTYTGTTTVSGGALTLTGTLAGPVIVNAATNFNVNGPSTLFLANNTVTNNGTTNFNTTGSAALAAFTNNAGGIVDISGTTLGTTIGSLTGAGNVNLGSKALTLGGRNIANTISGVISGVGGSLIKTGTQTLTLSAANTYTGMTTVNNGTLTLSGSLMGPIQVNAGTFNVSGVTLVAANTINNSGITNFTGAASSDSASITNSGTLNYNNASTAGTSAITNTATHNLNFNNTSTAGNSIITNDGTTNFNSTALSSDATVINNGTVTLGQNTTLGSLSGPGNVGLGIRTLTTGVLNQADNISGIISGTGGVTKAGTNTLTLSTLIGNTYSGPTNINGGIVSVSASNQLGNGAGTNTLRFNNGTLETTGTFATTRGVTLNAGGGTFQVDPGVTTTLSGIIGGTGSLTKTGAGNLVLTGANNIAGGITNSAGTLTGTAASLNTPTIANAAALVFDQVVNATFAGIITGSGTFQKLGVGNLTLTGANNIAGGITNTAGTLTGTATSLNTPTIANAAALIFNQAVDATFAGVITGAGTFQKLGAGNLTLTGANTIAGGITNTAGTLTGTADSLNTPTIANAAALVFDQAVDATFAGIITGGGTFQKLGAGNLTLTGANTYTGGTTITGGTLTGTTTSLTGNILDDAALVFDQGFDATFAGNISGTGSLTKLSGGNLTLSGVNTYSGPTNINGGTLSISANNQIGDGSATNILTLNNGTLETTASFTLSQPVTLAGVGGTFQVDPGITTTLSGDIAGTALTKTGTGNLVLRGSNSYTGGTTITEGTLTGTTTSLTGNILDNAALVFDQGFNGTFAGNISGTGSLTKLNGGNVTLSGVNTYTGGTTITGGTLTGTTTSLTGNIIDNAALVFDQGFNGTFAGQISGIGSLTKLNGGNVTLSGVNTYTGGTTIAGGTLTGTTTSLTGNIVDNAALVFDQGFNGTFASQISGTGSLTKLGEGILTLSGANTYLGDTVIGGGILANNGSLTSRVIVNTGTVYQGNGSSLSLINSGTVSPGNSSIGKLTVNGNYTQTSTGILIAELTPGGLNDLLQITGIASLGGTLNIVPTGNIFSFGDKKYTILTANAGVFGNFASIISPPLLKYKVRILPTSVIIEPEQLLISSLVQGGNAGRIAQYLDRIITAGTVSSDLDTVLIALGDAAAKSNAALTDALDQISPDPYRELSFLAFDQTNLVRETVGTQQQRILDALSMKALSLTDVSPTSLLSFQQLMSDRKRGDSFQSKSFMSNRPANMFQGGVQSLDGGNLPLNKMVKIGDSSVWIESYGQLQNKNNSPRIVGTKNRTYGTTLGGDTLVLPNTYVGVMGGTMNTDFNWKQHRGNGNVRNYYGGMYGLWLSTTGLYVDGQVTFGLNRYRTRRKINFETIHRTAREHHNGLSVSTDLETGYLLTLGKTVLQPFFNFAYIAGHEKSFREKGAASLNIHRNAKTSQFSRSELGSLFSHFFGWEETLIYPTVKLSWVQKRPLHKGDKNVKFNFTDQTLTATVKGDNRVRNLLSTGISLTAQFKSGIYVTGDINGEIGSGEKAAQAMLSIGYQF